jgi:uncharacterized protein (UPF0276 family)
MTDKEIEFLKSLPEENRQYILLDLGKSKIKCKYLWFRKGYLDVIPENTVSILTIHPRSFNKISLIF